MVRMSVLVVTHGMSTWIIKTSAAMGQNRLKPARQKLERALAIRQETKVNPASLAMTRFLLAKTLWQAGQERNRALALAIEALEAWSQSDAAIWKKYRQEAEAWLAQRRK